VRRLFPLFCTAALYCPAIAPTQICSAFCTAALYCPAITSPCDPPSALLHCAALQQGQHQHQHCHCPAITSTSVPPSALLLCSVLQQGQHRHHCLTVCRLCYCCIAALFCPAARTAPASSPDSCIACATVALLPCTVPQQGQHQRHRLPLLHCGCVLPCNHFNLCSAFCSAVLYCAATTLISVPPSALLHCIALQQGQHQRHRLLPGACGEGARRAGAH
jgi:hypothetical protein